MTEFLAVLDWGFAALVVAAIGSRATDKGGVVVCLVLAALLVLSGVVAWGQP